MRLWRRYDRCDGVFRRPRQVTLRRVRAWRSIRYAGWTSEPVARFLEVFRSVLLPRLRYRKDIHLPTWSPLRYPQIWVHQPKMPPQESHSFESTPFSSAFSYDQLLGEMTHYDIIHNVGLGKGCWAKCVWEWSPGPHCVVMGSHWLLPSLSLSFCKMGITVTVLPVSQVGFEHHERSHVWTLSVNSDIQHRCGRAGGREGEAGSWLCHQLMLKGRSSAFNEWDTGQEMLTGVPGGLSEECLLRLPQRNTTISVA